MPEKVSGTKAVFEERAVKAAHLSEQGSAKKTGRTNTGANASAPYKFALLDERRAINRKIECTPNNFVPSSKVRVAVAGLRCSVQGTRFKGTPPMRDAISTATGGAAFQYDSTGGFMTRLCASSSKSAAASVGVRKRRCEADIASQIIFTSIMDTCTYVAS